MIWPRGFVAAAAFWNYNSTADPSSADFTNAIYTLNDDIASRGGLVCPTNCSCDQVSFLPSFCAGSRWLARRGAGRAWRRVAWLCGAWCFVVGQPKLPSVFRPTHPSTVRPFNAQVAPPSMQCRRRLVERSQRGRARLHNMSLSQC